MIVALWILRPDDPSNGNKPHNNADLAWCSRFPDKPIDQVLGQIAALGNYHLAVYYYRHSQHFGIRTYLSPRMLSECPESAPTLTAKKAIFKYLYEEKNYVESIPTDHLHRIIELVSSPDLADDGDFGSIT